jgi:hypothetical protein
MKLRSLLIGLWAAYLPILAPAQALEPSQICERLLAAYQTSDFSSVSPYVHSKTLKVFRNASSLIIGHAAEKYGEAPLVEFFEGTNLRELDSLSDEDYWATVMAHAMRFAGEKPRNITQPIAQFGNETGLVFVYSGTTLLKTAPEAGSFVWHRAYCFQEENGAWKLSSLVVDTFEASLCAFLQIWRPASPP